MTDLAPHLSTFLQVHLPNERRVSPHTLQSYTECFRLLVVFASERLGVRPSKLTIEHLAVPLLTAFLEHLETDRKNRISTRNVRLAAIKSFHRYLEYQVPGCLDLALQVRAIPAKIADKPLIDWLGKAEIQAILDAPDPSTPPGLRDRAMLHLCHAARAAGVGTDCAHTRQPVRTRARDRPHHGQGTSRTGIAALERDRNRSRPLAKRPAGGQEPLPVPQCTRRDNEHGRLLLHPQAACRHRS